MTDVQDIAPTRLASKILCLHSLCAIKCTQMAVVQDTVASWLDEIQDVASL